ncbi:kidins220, partial [Symbiodinium microadriaticum]
SQLGWRTLFYGPQSLLEHLGRRNLSVGGRVYDVPGYAVMANTWASHHVQNWYGRESVASKDHWQQRWTSFKWLLLQKPSVSGMEGPKPRIIAFPSWHLDSAEVVRRLDAPKVENAEQNIGKFCRLASTAAYFGSLGNFLPRGPPSSWSSGRSPEEWSRVLKQLDTAREAVKKHAIRSRALAAEGRQISALRKIRLRQMSMAPASEHMAVQTRWQSAQYESTRHREMECEDNAMVQTAQLMGAEVLFPVPPKALFLEGGVDELLKQLRTEPTDETE